MLTDRFLKMKKGKNKTEKFRKGKIVVFNFCFSSLLFNFQLKLEDFYCRHNGLIIKRTVGLYL